MIVAFFGYPGAGKSTLVARFALLTGAVGIDTDRFMTDDERAAVVEGRYTAEMRHANIRRYCAHLRETVRPGGHAALADGLPTNAARRLLLAELGAERVRLVLVRTEPALWAGRLAARAENPVAVGVAEAAAYVREHWEPIDPALPCETIDNVENLAVVDAALVALFARAAGQPIARG